MSRSKEDEIELAWAWWRETYNRPSAVLTLSLRQQLAEQQNWRCCYCGIRMGGIGQAWDAPTFEHVTPRSKGGTDEIENLIIACRRCNEDRGNGEAA